MDEEYNMADDIKLLLFVETTLIKMDEVHKGMPLRDEVATDLSAVRAKVQEVKDQLSSMQVVVQANDEAINTLTSKADEANSHLAKHTELMQQILATLQQPILAPETSFNAEDPRDDDLPITSAANAGDMEDDDEDEDGDSPDLPDACEDLGNDDDEHDNDDNCTIQ
ncbi:uncharacterized protein LOC112504209 [Cynara cardunculus var. scolymus]|uniref:uncharacterized protein LOC112504209 n=1 Tax=Cynara cardunculus var. scolymus TaxID=59895 RepID=UPI000D629EA7|nr:uncharacterized protein LOC112504209 [Cynara cardunculus var. scolymus]